MSQKKEKEKIEQKAAAEWKQTSFKGAPGKAHSEQLMDTDALDLIEVIIYLILLS